MESADPTRTKPFPLGAILQPSSCATQNVSCHRKDNWLRRYFWLSLMTMESVSIFGRFFRSGEQSRHLTKFIGGYRSRAWGLHNDARDIVTEGRSALRRP